MVLGPEHSSACGPRRLRLGSFPQEPVFTKASIHKEEGRRERAGGRGEEEEEVDGKMCAVESRPLI